MTIRTSSVTCTCIGLSHPHCEKKGESIAWCELIAILVGSADIVVTLVVISLFVRAKGGAKCLCFTVRTRARAVSVSVGQGITDLFDHMQGPEAVRARILYCNTDSV
jgi:hypothetical protein